ncbi:hypothetical protein DFH27DRAFT_128040 [Peziza echinospora]|nr:hypothetical protein DFH27DRAFT_128040 [Peziza echinospora]
MATFDPEVLRLLEIIRNASSSSSSGSGGGGGGATTGMPATQQQTASSQQQAQSIPPPTSSPSITTTQDPRLNRAPKASIPPPQSYTHPHTHAHPPQPQAPAQAHSYTQFQPQQQQQQQQQTSKLDPRTITTYPSALRYITTTLLPQNPNLLPRLRRLRINQHNNERQWHRSRQELVQKHKRRKLNTKNVEDILFNLTNAIGGGAKGGSNNNNNTPPTTTTGAEEREMEELRRKEEEELRAFDGKVWKAARGVMSVVEAHSWVANLGYLLWTGWLQTSGSYFIKLDSLNLIV